MWAHGLRPRPIAFLLFFLLLLAQSALAQITANPAQGAAGTSVTVRGTGWTPGDLVTFAWEFNVQNTISSVRVDNNGNFTATVSVPQGAPLGPTYIDAGDQATFRTAQTSFTVISQSVSCPSPRIYFSRISGPVGTKSTLTANDWAPGGTVDIMVPRGSKALFSMSPLTPHVSPSGEWQAEMTVDPPTPVGEYIISFEETTASCSLGAHPTFTVKEPLPTPTLSEAFIRCPNAPFIFPVGVESAYIGWLYKEPSTDPSVLHSGLDIYVPEGTPVMAVATGEVSRGVGYSAQEQSYNVDIHYTAFGVETYTDNLLNVQVHQGSMVTAGTVIGYAGSYLDHIHWSITGWTSPPYYNEQTDDWEQPTTLHRDPTPYLTPKGNLNFAKGAQEHRSPPLTWWCTLH